MLLILCIEYKVFYTYKYVYHTLIETGKYDKMLTGEMWMFADLFLRYN